MSQFIVILSKLGRFLLRLQNGRKNVLVNFIGSRFVFNPYNNIFKVNFNFNSKIPVVIFIKINNINLINFLAF